MNTQQSDQLTRRRALQLAVASGSIMLAGCTGDKTEGQPAEELDETEGTADADDGNGGESSAPALPQVEDPPDVVYVPTHIESMRHLDPVSAGEFEIIPMITYPHLFWNVTGTEVVPAEPSAEDDVHLMVTVRDPETGMILPAETGLELTVGPAGESGSPHSPWPMISQEMGFHIGDNVPLGDDGAYEISVRVGSIDARTTGEFADRFQDAGEGTFTFTFDQEFREEVVGGIEYLDEEHWGEPGALAPTMHLHMGHGDHEHDHGDEHQHDDHEHGHDHDDEHGHDDHDHEHGDDDHDHEHGHETHDDRFGTFDRDRDITELPPVEDLPGAIQEATQSGDAVIATTVLDRGSRFVDGDEYYLAVSPRTPYNRGMLPMMTIDVTIERDGETIVSEELQDTIDHELGYHYAIAVEELHDGDEVTFSFPSPPGVSRHQGYETAFIEMDPVTVAIEGVSE